MEAVQLEVIAKHTLTGDDHIGTASISLEAIQVRLKLLCNLYQTLYD